MNPILMAALFGAAGAAIGSGAAWAAGKMLGRQPGWLKLIPAFCVVFAVALGRVFQPTAQDRLMAQIDELPTVRAIKAHYPNDYSRLEAGVRNARSDADAGRAADEVLGAVLVRQRAQADAESAVSLYEVTRAEGRALQKSDPEGCAAFMEGRPAPGLSGVQTPELRAQDRNASAKLLEQTALRPAPPAKPMAIEDLTPLGAQAIAAFPEAKQNLVISLLKSGRTPQAGAESQATCDFNLALADVILARPRLEAGALVRSMWAMR